MKNTMNFLEKKEYSNHLLFQKRIKIIGRIYNEISQKKVKIKTFITTLSLVTIICSPVWSFGNTGLISR
jgi:hypothetical protein